MSAEISTVTSVITDQAAPALATDMAQCQALEQALHSPAGGAYQNEIDNST